MYCKTIQRDAEKWVTTGFCLPDRNTLDSWQEFLWLSLCRLNHAFYIHKWSPCGTTVNWSLNWQAFHPNEPSCKKAVVVTVSSKTHKGLWQLVRWGFSSWTVILDERFDTWKQTSEKLPYGHLFMCINWKSTVTLLPENSTIMSTSSPKFLWMFTSLAAAEWVCGEDKEKHMIMILSCHTFYSIWCCHVTHLSISIMRKERGDVMLDGHF